LYPGCKQPNARSNNGVGRGRKAEEKSVRIGRLAGNGWLAFKGRLARHARRLGLDRNPLRRRTDRIESTVAAGLLALFLIGAPLAGALAGRWAQQGGLREQRAQEAWHQTSALTLTGAPGAPGVPKYAYRTSWNFPARVPARWMGPDGRYRFGLVSAALGTQAGQTVLVWVDASGRATGPPLLRSQLVSRKLSAEALAPAALAILLLGLAGLVRWLLNRRRLKAWEMAWTTIGPRWTRHH
jgi:hypothetical protein